MRVGILGGGALGTLLGGLLAAADREVVVVDRDPDHVDALRDGLELRGATETTVAVDATTDPATAGGVDLLLVCVKTYQTDAALTAAGAMYETATVCTLQNGLGAPETVADYVPRERVVAGTTAHGATLEGPGRVRHAGAGPTRVGAYFEAASDRVEAVVDTLAPLGARAVPNVRDAIWEKLLVNLGINAPTALARVSNGALADGPGERVLERAVEEGKRVGEAAGRDIPAEAVDRALEVASATATNVSSMRADLEAGRRTEVEAIYGAVVERGEEHGVPTPVTRTLAELVRLAENR